MNIRRLRIWERFIRTVPPEQFSMFELWTGPEGTHPLRWACGIPEFQEEGLKMENGEPTYRGYRGYNAAEHFFGLNLFQAGKLLAPSLCMHITSPDMFADEIIKLVAEDLLKS